MTPKLGFSNTIYGITVNHHTCVHNIEASCFPCSDNAPIGFSEVDKITTESIDVYNTIVSQLLPTPAKSHYTFNLRDLSKVFQGMLMVDGAKVDVSLPLDSISSFSARVVFCPCVFPPVRSSARAFFRPCVFPPVYFSARRSNWSNFYTNCQRINICYQKYKNSAQSVSSSFIKAEPMCSQKFVNLISLVML